MRYWLRYWWRRLRGRCVACAGRTYGGGYRGLCRLCWKTYQHARNYGMGERRLREL